MLGSRSGYVRRVEDIAGDGAGLAVGADWRVGGAVGGAGRRALGCAAGVRHSRPGSARGAGSLRHRDGHFGAVWIGPGRWTPVVGVAWALCAGRGAASVAGGHGPDRAGGRRQGFRAAARAQRHPAARCRRRRGIAGPSRRSCSSVLDALCRQPASAPGVYRAALALRVDRQGQIGSVRLLDSTGSAARDAAIRAALQGLPVGEPSGDPGKAYVVLVLPRESRKPADCASAP